MKHGDLFDWGIPIDELRSGQRPRCLDTVLIENEDGPDELAIYDQETDESEKWIVASGSNSFVSLDEIL